VARASRLLDCAPERPIVGHNPPRSRCLITLRGGSIGASARRGLDDDSLDKPRRCSLDVRLRRRRPLSAEAPARAAYLRPFARLLISLQVASPVSWPLVVIVASWALILFCGFGVLSRINPTTIVALGFGAFAVGSALFLILELTQQFTGVFRVPSGAFEEMLVSLDQ
jgi:hypothetical protein